MPNPFTVSVKADIEAASDYLGVVEKDVIQQATTAALNKGIRETRKIGLSEMAEQTNLPARELSKKLRTRLATQRLNAATLRLNARGFNPITLGYTPSQAITFYNGAFVGRPFYATMPNNSGQIAVRLPSSKESIGKDSKGRPRRNRLPINTIRLRVGVKAIRVMSSVLEKEGREAFIDEYYRQIEMLTAR